MVRPLPPICSATRSKSHKPSQPWFCNRQRRDVNYSDGNTTRAGMDHGDIGKAAKEIAVKFLDNPEKYKNKVAVRAKMKSERD